MLPAQCERYDVIDVVCHAGDFPAVGTPAALLVQQFNHRGNIAA